jgi:hypothetical protein
MRVKTRQNEREINYRALYRSSNDGIGRMDVGTVEPPVAWVE